MYKHHLAVGLLVCIFLSCSEPTNNIEQPNQNSLFDRPQAVVWINDYFVVSNSGYSSTNWRDGFLAIVDAESGDFINRLESGQLNPQIIRVHGDQIWVLNSGTYDLTEFDQPKSDSPGGLDIWSVDDLGTVGAAPTNYPTPIDLESPSDFLVLEDSVFIASALRPSYVIAQRTDDGLVFGETMTLSTNAELGLGRVTSWRSFFLLLDFNSDQLHVIETDGRLRCQLHVGRDEDEMEGATTPVIHNEHLYFIMALSGELRRLSLEELIEDCSPTVETVVSPLGQIPNDLQIRGNEAFIVHSGDNQVTSYDLDSGERTHRWILPVGSNPWSLAIDASGQRMAVTHWASSSLTIYDVSSGEELLVR